MADNNQDPKRKWGSSARHRDQSSLKKFSNSPSTSPSRDSPPSSPLGNRESAPHSPSSSTAGSRMDAPLSPPSLKGRKLSARERLLGDHSEPTPFTPSMSDLMEQQKKEQWRCGQCKYQNADPNGMMCALCGCKRSEAKLNSSRSLFYGEAPSPSEASLKAEGYISESSEKSGKSETYSVKTIPTSNKDEQVGVDSIPEYDDMVSTEEASSVDRMEMGGGSTTAIAPTPSESANSAVSESDMSIDGSSHADDALWEDEVSEPALPEPANPIKPGKHHSSRKKRSADDDNGKTVLWCCSKRVAITSAIALLIATICFAIVAIVSAPGDDSSGDGLESMGESFTGPPIFGGGVTNPPTASTPPPTPLQTESNQTPTAAPNPTQQVDLVLLGEDSINPIGPNVGISFGSSVAVSTDGSTVVVGAPLAKKLATDTDNQSPGLVQVHRLVQGNWKQIGQDLFGLNQRDRMGSAVAITPDGSTIAISAPFFNDPLRPNNIDAGQVLIYKYDGEDNVWNPLGSSGIIGKRETERLGSRVAISEDGLVVSVASHGYVQVYKYDASLDRWSEHGQVFGIGSRQWPSWETSLSLDGKTVAVGSPSFELPGRAIVYDFDEDEDRWIRRGRDLAAVFPAGTNTNAVSTPIVSLSGDGNTVAVRVRSGVARTSISVFSFNEDQDDWEVLGEDNRSFTNTSFVPDSSDSNIPETLTLSMDGRRLTANVFSTLMLFVLDSLNKEWVNVMEAFSNDSEDGADTVSLSGDSGVLAIGDVAVGGVSVYEFE